ncbi:hypothetical protein LZ554_005577 [Drepanopeziza brunnea f. sp. 'monogermtubi']|nr:hypothetical protein LZ554_005577 [Drepanopeziza brunnea f. sp. 'monogermtubi']
MAEAQRVVDLVKAACIKAGLQGAFIVDGFIIFGHPFLSLTSRTVFRWTRSQTRTFKTFGTDPTAENPSFDLPPFAVSNTHEFLIPS